MSTYKTLPRPALSAQPIPMLKDVKVSPAKARRLENVMRGMSQHGITQIGFGNDATTVDVNDLYPMEISKSIPEEKDVDQYTPFMSSDITPKVNKMSMRQRRRSSQQSTQSILDTSSKDSISGRKRRGNEVPLQALTNYPNKRHCDNTGNYISHNGNSNMMALDDPNSRFMSDIDPSEMNHELLSLKTQHTHVNEQLMMSKQEIRDLNTDNRELRHKLAEMEQRLTKQIEITEKYETEKARNDRACDSLTEVLNEIAISERRERESKLIEDNKLLGRVVRCHSSNFGSMSDIWEDGQLFENLKRRRKALEKEKEAMELKKKELRKLKAKRQKENKENANQQNRNNSGGFLVPQRKMMDKLSLESEINSIQLVLMKKQLQELDVEECTLEYRKKLHIKFIRLMRDEKKSRFSSNKKHECYVLNDRYVLTNLLGRGGFSEVHRGYDLVEHKYIAAKIHQLNIQWSDERKKNYTKHATREYDIHKTLNHTNVVSLYDVFGIDVNSFCTVLEYCDGMDLDMYLKINKTLTEREARNLIIQVFIGLKYLHNSLPIIIHYDLKPGNLLYKNGHIKLTDFGLAKIMEQESECIELTSQGAGTYWYLPPECFRSHSQNKPVMISPKVDIWSAGVIFYQMLFGKRPFGDNLSQDSILNNKTILNARCVTFPNQPRNVSKEAKDFMSQCCAYDPKLRLSSNHIVDNHAYFAFLRK
eukprot:549612_1